MTEADDYAKRRLAAFQAALDASTRSDLEKAHIQLSEAPKMIPVILESPYAGDVKTNLRYLRAAMRDCLLRGEAPFASHGLYTQDGVLDDTVPEEREHGIQAGFAWRSVAHKTVFYTDLGESRGMKYGLEHAKKLGHEVEYRTVPGWVTPEQESVVTIQRKGV